MLVYGEAVKSFDGDKKNKYCRQKTETGRVGCEGLRKVEASMCLTLRRKQSLINIWIPRALSYFVAVAYLASDLELN